MWLKSKKLKLKIMLLGLSPHRRPSSGIGTIPEHELIGTNGTA
jgi:hypothetical protein